MIARLLVLTMVFALALTSAISLEQSSPTRAATSCVFATPPIVPIALTRPDRSGSWSGTCSSGTWKVDLAGASFKGTAAGGSFSGLWTNYSFGGGSFVLLGPGLETVSGSWDDYSFGGGSFQWLGPNGLDSVTGDYSTFSNSSSG